MSFFVRVQHPKEHWYATLEVERTFNGSFNIIGGQFHKHFDGQFTRKLLNFFRFDLEEVQLRIEEEYQEERRNT